MTLFTMVASGGMAYGFFNISSSFSNTDDIAERLSAYPARQTAYKIGILGGKAGFFWAGLNSLATCAGSIYSMITGYAVFATSSLFMTTLIASSALNLGVLALSLLPLLYARAWEVFQVSRVVD